MKKALVILLAFALVFAFVFAACSNGTTGSRQQEPPVTEGDEDNWTSAYSTSQLVLEQNVYSDGYQVYVRPDNLFGGKQIKKDDEYTLEIVFTVSRAVAAPGIQIGLVDTVTDYWNPLTWNGADDAPENEKMNATGALVVGETYTQAVKMKALKDAPQAGPNYNTLVFQTEKEFTRPSGNTSIIQPDQPITVSFTKFVFMKGDGGGTPPPPPPPPPPPAEEPEITIVNTTTATHDNFKFVVSTSSAHGSWDGDDTVANKFVIKSGAIRYQFPSTATFKASDYDFVKIDYEAKTVKDIVYKEYNSSSDIADVNGAIAVGTGDVTFEIRYCVGGGFALQKWSAASVTPATEIEITKVTFIKGTRYTITFDPDAAGVTAPTSPAFVVLGTKFGTLPSLTRTGFIHTGWLLGTNEVTPTTEVTAAFNNATLKATWKSFTAYADQTVTFTLPGNLYAMGNPSATPNSQLADVAVVNGGAGYTVETHANAYGNSWACFTYTFTGGASLSDFNVVRFTYQAISGDTNDKVLRMIASNDIRSGGDYLNLESAATPVGTQSVTGSASIPVELTIDQGAAAALNTTVEFVIGIHGTDYKIQITNVTFSQD
jgi:hypothetical protein